jgi:hypothetical protein
MDMFPLWGIFLSSILVIALFTELGFVLGKRARDGKGGEEKAQTGPVVGASLGLLAFMLAFTFGTAATSYNKRKDVIVEEANAIGTAFLRADLVPAAERAQIRPLLREYVGLRIGREQDVQDDALLVLMKVSEAVVRSEKIQQNLWSIGVAIARENPTAISSLYLQSINMLIDVHQKRLAVVLYHRMPSIFWIAIYCLAVLAMLMAGYDAGLASKRRSFTSQLAITLAFSAMLLLVVALDRPYAKLSLVPQAPLIEVQNDIERSIRSG